MKKKLSIVAVILFGAFTVINNGVNEDRQRKIDTSVKWDCSYNHFHAKQKTKAEIVVHHKGLVIDGVEHELISGGNVLTGGVYNMYKETDVVTDKDGKPSNPMNKSKFYNMTCNLVK